MPPFPVSHRLTGPRFLGPRFLGPRFLGPRFLGLRLLGPALLGRALLGLALLSIVLCCKTSVALAQENASDPPVNAEQKVREFRSQTLSQIYFSEGTAVGDLNGDQVPDIVYGPHWFAGPDFQVGGQLYPPVPQPLHAYADNFFSWIYDFDQDGHNDVLTVGFPGTSAYVYQNPGLTKASGPNVSSAQTSDGWTKHEVFDWVSNESPAFVDLVGDAHAELVCTRDGVFGYAVPKLGSFETWTFWPISDSMTAKTFGHGLGVGDVNGDGRNDVLCKDGWFEQPATVARETRWRFHPFEFAGPGGAEMYAYDVDGDGDNDVITSLHAHEYGLAWYEQTATAADGEIQFQQHLIMGSRPSQNEYGVYFSEPHSVALADIDGDGLPDIVTGKTYGSHHRQSPNWDAGAVVYWFQLQRRDDGVHWVPHLADDSAGIGRQIVVADVNGDQQNDIVTGGMLGAHVLTQTVRTASAAEFAAAQPQARRPITEDLSGTAAAAAMNVPQGFQVQLAAAEPDVHQPVAMAFDHRGRLWVAEAYTYPIRAAEGEGLDKIVILEDTNQDGKLDRRTVFAEGLNLVSGLEVGLGGVWIGAAPYLMFIPDADGDDVPDGPAQILLEGFGYQDTHETLNTFNWGPDGWLYGCQGVFTHSKIRKPLENRSPANAKIAEESHREPEVVMNAGVWRYHPTRHVFEVYAEGTSNPWGVDFNDHGQAFITACVIPHLYHVIPGARYQRQAGQHNNPYTYDDIKTIADHLHYAGNIQDHAWWGNEPPIQDDTSDAGGGHAHCGAMIYLGDNWPDRFRNSLFFHNIHGNRVNCDRLVRSGSGYTGKHSDDLLLANDRWFRGINLRYGPDGSVYLIDWYDKNACHRTNPEIWDRTNGRVYNISYGQTQRTAVNLADQSDAQLAAMAWHANDWYVRTARKLLQHRAALGSLDQKAVRSEVDKLLDATDDTRVLRGMWLAHATGLLNPEELLALTQHPSPFVIAWSLQLAAEDGSISAAFLTRMQQLSRDSQTDPLVRLYLAAVLQRLPGEQRWDVIEGLTQHAGDANDHNLPLMIWYATEPLVAQDAGRAIRMLETSKIPQVNQFIVRRAAAEPQSLERLLSLSESFDEVTAKMVVQQVLQSLEGQVNVTMPTAWSAAYSIFTKSNDPDTRKNAVRLAVQFGDRRVFHELRNTLSDEGAAIGERLQALEILVAGRDELAGESLLTAIQTPELQSPAIRALAAYRLANTPTVLLENYAKLNVAAKADAISTLVSRVAYTQSLLEAIDAGRVPRSDLHAYHVRQIQSFDDPKLTARLEQIWGTIGTSSLDQQQAITQWKNQLAGDALNAADKGHGRMLFQKNCATCHQLFGAGEKVGPDLTGSNRANLDYILENILAPSAVVGKDYQMTLLQLIDGRVVSGLIAKETDSALTLRTINDQVVIAKDDIEERKLSELSLMPGGLLDNLSPTDVADLVAYLGSPQQVEVQGPEPAIDPQTGKVPHVLEGESLKVIEKSNGRATSQDMQGFQKDRWSGNDHLWWTGAQVGDRLSVEIPVAADGKYDITVCLTKAPDYGIVQIYWDDQAVGSAIDCYVANTVINSGMLNLGSVETTAGDHRLTLEIVGTNPAAVPAHLVGLDFVLLEEK